MNNNYEINKLRVQQLGLSTTIKDDDGNEHYFYRGHEYVEIGGIKWAVTNVGAEKESDSGLYFAFGETQGYTTEQIRRGERRFIQKEYTDVEFDSVNAYWGGKWRMPTEAEFQALLSSTINEWVYNYQGSEVSGRLFTDKTDSSKKLFFPTVGTCFSGIVYNVGTVSYYWLSSNIVHNFQNSGCLYLDRSFYCISVNSRFVGLPIRGVIGE